MSQNEIALDNREIALHQQIRQEFYLEVSWILEHSYYPKKILKADRLNSFSCAHEFSFILNLPNTTKPERQIRLLKFAFRRGRLLKEVTLINFFFVNNHEFFCVFFLLPNLWFDILYRWRVLRLTGGCKLLYLPISASTMDSWIMR